MDAVRDTAALFGTYTLLESVKVSQHWTALQRSVAQLATAQQPLRRGFAQQPLSPICNPDTAHACLGGELLQNGIGQALELKGPTPPCSFNEGTFNSKLPNYTPVFQPVLMFCSLAACWYCLTSLHNFLIKLSRLPG